MPKLLIKHLITGTGVYGLRVSLQSIPFLLLTALPLTHADEVLGTKNATLSAENTADPVGEVGDLVFEENGGATQPYYAVLFPPFSLTIGVIVFYMLSRHARALPYTAVMFFIGTLMGVGAELAESSDHINQTIRTWVPIDSEVLLLIFLPGLIFKDSYGQNVHLFRLALLQMFIFAFPLVLAGAILTALVAFHIFPYGWSFNLAMTFGSILAATDPVAVAALLEQVGAPPRLKVHIAGESLLNDGSAIVFFSIFSQRYLYELGLPGVGEDVDWGRGIALFFQKSLGGVAIGTFFGLGMLSVFYLLHRRFNREENVVEVTASIAIAYLGYYVAEPVWETSGVIATVTAGLIVKFFGRGMINDHKLLDDFWALIEHLLNTILFTLGGVVWGAVIAHGEKRGIFASKDWGYLIMLYVLLHLIRTALFVLTYPITVRIGLSTNWQETVFQVYGGLRGAVGIALSLFLDNEIKHLTGDTGTTEFEQQTTTVFAMVGGVAFMTLVINGTTAGPLLNKLGLADSTQSRQKIVDAYRARFRASAIDDFVQLLTQPLFRHVNFALVKHHVPYLADLTKEQLLEAVKQNKETTLMEEYNPPYLSRILPYLKNDNMKTLDPESSDVMRDIPEDESMHFAAEERKRRHALRAKLRQNRRNSSSLQFMMQGEPLSAQELRVLFVSILKAAYEKQVAQGELEDRHFLTVALEQSVEFASDAVSNGKPVTDCI